MTETETETETETTQPSATGVPAMDQVIPADPDSADLASRRSAPVRPEVFHAIAYRNDIWKEDPFDVATIHEEARAMFERLVNRAAEPAGAAAGRILLLAGEAGSGKTHLLRASATGCIPGAGAITATCR